MKLNFYVATAVGLCQSALASVSPGTLPPQSVFVSPQSFAVLNPNGTFRQNAFTEFLNPTNATPPFFQIFDQGFLEILGPNPSFHEIASNDTFPFAHEAPIYVPETDEVFFASRDGPGLFPNNKVGKISMAAVEAAIKALTGNTTGAPVNVPVTELDLPDTIQNTNGGTGPFHSSLLLITSGRGPLPPSIALVNPKPPFNVTVLLDNFFGRQFNSLNDIKIHPTSGAFFFTDPIYGFLGNFRPPPLLPIQVYKLDPATGAVSVVATDFDRCNGIAFTPDGKIAYIQDTGAVEGFLGNNQTRPATIYAYDVHPVSGVFLNRRIFAYVDAGIPDGVQVDSKGNVYSSCGDGVHVFSSTGTLLGKFFIGSVTANLVFAGDGRLVINAETKMFLATIAAKEGKVAFP